jgi:hypothetical protein
MPGARPPTRTSGGDKTTMCKGPSNAPWDGPAEARPPSSGSRHSSDSRAHDAYEAEGWFGVWEEDLVREARDIL